MHEASRGAQASGARPRSHAARSAHLHERVRDDELEDLGDRFQERFETLLTKPFVNESYVVSFSLQTY